MAAQSALRFQLYRDSEREWRWRLRARNGRLIAESGEGYKRKAGAQNGMMLIVAYASAATIPDIETTSP